MRRPLYLVVILVGTAVLIAVLASRARTADEKPKEGNKPSATAPRQEDAKRNEGVSRFMRKKLDASNLVLEGLVTEDFALIEKGAATMKRLSAAEEWQISNDAMYRQHSNQFRRVMEKLEKRAKDKQLEGATLAWVEGTMSCLECHKWVRNNIIAGR